MKTLCKRFFAPGINSAATSFGLLILRLWFGLSMLLLHGWGKFTGFSEMKEKFPGIFGLSPAASLALAVFGEAFCSVLLVLGLFTRFAALALAITMVVAFGIGHGFKLIGPGSGEMAFIYLAGFVTLLFAGPGRYSADAYLFGKTGK